ncbi:MAG TPA: glycosyltransferase [Anaeromyxobacter sp.]|nr:glycosyltransferase [Anaeromyxobacter sp.]
MGENGSRAEVRVVVVAEHASARFGGEAILPLHYFRLLRRRGVEAWLVVHERSRPELRDELPGDLERVVFVPDTRLQRACWGIGRRLPPRLYQVTLGLVIHAATQWAERRVVRALVPRVRATVVHEPIPVSPRGPSLMHGVGAPVVIGPMNGGMTYPPAMRQAESWLERAYIGVSRSFAALANLLVPGKRRAYALLVANERTRRALPRGVCRRVYPLVENGVDLALFRPPQGARLPDGRTRFVFIGRLVRLKGLDLLLEAVARVGKAAALELHVLGDGPERPALEAHARRLGLQERVVFHGLLPQDRCAAILASSDGLVLPSLLECGGAVVLEAMAVGLPVIATRWGGPADYLDDETGVLVEPAGVAPFVEGLASAMARLAGSPELRARLGRAARRRVEERFDWERKIDRILEIYREAMEHAAAGGRPRQADLAVAEAAPR